MPCPRCGRTVMSPAELWEMAGCAFTLADRVRDGLASMRLCIPQKVANAVRELATSTAPRLHQGLACLAGTCCPPAAAGTEAP
jgi:hypothetical protein